MAINIKFDLAGNPEPPTIILAKRNSDRLGQLEVDQESIDLNDKLNDFSEFSFTLYKYIDNRITNLWDEVTNFKLVYCKEWDMWFEITVELDEETETIKTVMCTQLGQAELSQIMLYDIHINEEGDSNWNKDNKEYKSTILYDENNHKTSLLHRLIKDKAPHYSIRHVDDTIKNIQRTFSFDGDSIYDAFMKIAEEIGCLFVFHSDTDKNGKVQREFSVYDLQQNCLNPECAHRGEFIDKCPKCGSSNIKYGYGEDTTIFVTSDELAADGIKLTTNTDEVKNCFKLEAGDDLMTATIRNCNPNGTDYIWYFSDDMKREMSDELVARIKSYDDEYKSYYNNYEFALNTIEYNNLVKKYKQSCINCGYINDESEFNNECPSCGSEDILINKDLYTVPSSIKGYSSLMNVYYNVIDLGLYLESGLMPSIEMSETNAEEQASLLTRSNLSPIAVEKLNIVSLATANSYVLSMAKIIAKSTYKVEINSSELSADKKTWKGSFVVTNYSDDEDTAISNTISITLNESKETFTEQKIEKALNKKDTDDYNITGLFKKELITKTVSGKKVFSGEFYKELKKYALNSLISFNDACQSCIDILIEQGAGNEKSNKDLYENLYLPYRNKLLAIQAEIAIRESEINFINEIRAEIEELKNNVQKSLNFESYLGESLWLEFCSYRREDKYSNNNYISDGLNNAELFKKASEFINAASDEIYKSAELQHSISTSLKNLLAIPKFKPLVKYFSVGNWIRIRIDEQIYKLRLLEYSINFGSFDEIPVEFSDVTKIKNGITDVQEVLTQASSMASSYSSVQKQASQGEESNSVLENWIENGLDATNTKIIGDAENQNQVLDNHGLLCRQYDPITDTYNNEQLKIVNSTIAITDDDWESTKTAVGKYYYIDPVTGEEITTYGVIGETIVGKMLLGKSLGLYNEDNSMSFDENGLVVKNSVNTFVVNPSSPSLITTYKNTTPTLSFDENGDLIIVGNITAKSLTLDTDVNINIKDENNNIVSDAFVKKDTPIGTVSVGKDGFKVSNDGLLEASNAIVYGQIYASGGEIGGWNIGNDKLYTKDDNYGYSIFQNPNTTRATSLAIGVTETDYNRGDYSNAYFRITRYGNLVLKGKTDGSDTSGGIIYCYDDADVEPSDSPRAEVQAKIKILTSKKTNISGASYSNRLTYIYPNRIYMSLVTQDSNNANIVKGGSMYLGYNKSNTIKDDNGNKVTGQEGTYFKFTRPIDIGDEGIKGTDGHVSLLRLSDNSDVAGSKNLHIGVNREYCYNTIRNIYLKGRNLELYAFGSTDTTTDGGISRYVGEIKLYGRLTRSIYLANDVELRGMKDGYINAVSPSGDAAAYSNALAFVEAITNRAVLGAVTNNAPTEIRSPSTIYLKGNGSTLDENRYAVCLSSSTVDGEGRGYFMPTFNSSGGTSFTDLGGTTHKWRNIWATNGTIETSDRNQKRNIIPLNDKYIQLFDLLKPVSYQMIEGDRVHTGFIAQDVEDAMNQVGLTSKEFGGFCKDVKTITDENGNSVIALNDDGSQQEIYSLRYNEFISINTAKIKQLEQRLEQAIEVIDKQQLVIEELKSKII